jgi:GT2 family glycosyltransferase
VTAVGVVIPVGPGREENLKACLAALDEQTVEPHNIVVVFDGHVAEVDLRPHDANLVGWVVPKHHPGMEQPRNKGVRVLDPAVEAVWFLDSDVLVEPTALEKLLEKWKPGRVVLAPYEWLPEGQREPDPELHNDPRWAMFREERWDGEHYVSTGELNVGLACFSGNLMWDINEFQRVGGFWSEIHHGRCEDGELGLRAVAEGIPMAVAREARGYHLWHPINTELAEARNARDVPMLNERHPWVEGDELFVVQRDGKRFEELCPKCRELINTGEIWEHLATCSG